MSREYSASGITAPIERADGAMRKQGTGTFLSLAVLMFGLLAPSGFAAEDAGDEAKAAIQKQAETFVEAFHKGEASAVAAPVDGGL